VEEVDKEIIGQKWISQCSYNYTERMGRVTILACINAKGASIPNFYIFKGKRMSRNYIVHWESGATRPCNPRPR